MEEKETKGKKTERYEGNVKKIKLILKVIPSLPTSVLVGKLIRREGRKWEERKEKQRKKCVEEKEKSRYICGKYEQFLCLALLLLGENAQCGGRRKEEMKKNKEKGGEGGNKLKQGDNSEKTW